MLHLTPEEVEDSRRPAPGPGARGLAGAVYDASPFPLREVRRMDVTRRGFVGAVAFGLALVLGATGWVEAQSTLEIVKKRGKLIAGVKTDFPPFGTIDAAGKNVGFDVDVAHRFAKALFNDENQVELVAVTSGNRIPFLQSGKIDIIILSLAKESPDLKAVGKPFVPRPYGIAVRKGDTEFITWVNAELAQMKKDGTYDRLWKKYFADVEANLVKP